MGGTLKIEIDIPDFQRELNMSITIRKDGEVITSLSPDSSVPTKTTKKKEPAQKSVSGNLMSMEL